MAQTLPAGEDDARHSRPVPGVTKTATARAREDKPVMTGRRCSRCERSETLPGHRLLYISRVLPHGPHLQLLARPPHGLVERPEFLLPPGHVHLEDQALHRG